MVFVDNPVFLAAKAEDVLTSRVPRLMPLSVHGAPTVSVTPAPSRRQGLASQRVVECR